MMDDWKARSVSIFAVGALFLITNYCLRLVFPDQVASLLAATAMWSLCIMLIIGLGEGKPRLAYRQGLFSGSFLAIFLATMVGSKLIGAAYPGKYVAVSGTVFLILGLLGIAFHLLVLRVLFTAAEREWGYTSRLSEGMRT
jgi:hypothetical protein